MQSVSVFIDIAQFTDFRWTLGVCHVIHIFLDLLWVRYNFAKFHHCRICETDFREGGLFALFPIHEQPPKSPSLIGPRDVNNNHPMERTNILKKLQKMHPAEKRYINFINRKIFYIGLGAIKKFIKKLKSWWRNS